MKEFNDFGVIEPQVLYSFRALQNRIGISQAAIRSARKQGLRVFYAHKQGFVLGKDWIDYVTDRLRSLTANSEQSLEA